MVLLTRIHLNTKTIRPNAAGLINPYVITGYQREPTTAEGRWHGETASAT